MPKKRSNLQNKLEYYAVRLVLGTVGLFPLSASMKIGEFIAEFIFRFIKRRHFVGLRNLELAFPELPLSEREKILRGTFKSLGRQLGMISHVSSLSADRLRAMVDTEGLEYCREEQPGKNGKLLFTGHFGGWELSNLVLAAYGFPMNVVARRIDNPLVENLVESIRTVFGSQTIDKLAPARTLFRLLQKGEFIGILVDLNTQEQGGVFVDFFGVPASTTTGLAKLALRTRVPVLPVFAVWQEEKSRYLLKICPPIEVPEGGDTSENVRVLTQRVTSKIEEYIRLYPQQWMWIHKRWNTRPPGQPNLYAKDFRAQSPKPKAQSQSELESES